MKIRNRNQKAEPTPELDPIVAKRVLAALASGDKTIEVIGQDGQKKTVDLTKKMFLGFPVDGDYTLLEKCKGFIALDWDGNAERVFFNIKSLDKSWLEPIDKGGIPMYGFDANGKVICGFGVYLYDNDGNKYHNDVQHLLVVAAKTTRGIW